MSVTNIEHENYVEYLIKEFYINKKTPADPYLVETLEQYEGPNK